jgi:3-(3-hydroxy-phenyl)propionate hydroxylase
VTTGNAEDGDGLLDICEFERSPHVREFIETAVKLGAAILSKPEVAGATNDGVPRAFRNSFTPQPEPGLGYR